MDWYRKAADQGRTQCNNSGLKYHEAGFTLVGANGRPNASIPPVDEMRSLRSSSALEGMRHSMNSAQHTMAKISGPRRQNASLRSFQFGWTVKAAVKAKMMPQIGHFQVHLRYR